MSARVAANGLSPSVRGLSALHHSWEGAGEDEDEHHAPKDVEDLRQRLRAKDERMYVLGVCDVGCDIKKTSKLSLRMSKTRRSEPLPSKISIVICCCSGAY